MENNKVVKETVNILAEIPNENLFIVHDAVWDKKSKKEQRYTLVGVRVGNVLRIGLTVCRTDDKFVRSVGRNEAAKKALEGDWTVPIISDDPLVTRNFLYMMNEHISQNFHRYKRTLAKPKEEKELKYVVVTAENYKGSSSSQGVTTKKAGENTETQSQPFGYKDV